MLFVWPLVTSVAEVSALSACSAGGLLLVSRVIEVLFKFEPCNVVFDYGELTLTSLTETDRWHSM